MVDLADIWAAASIQAGVVVTTSASAVDSVVGLAVEVASVVAPDSAVAVSMAAVDSAAVATAVAGTANT
jgi:hypothetical protein